MAAASSSSSTTPGSTIEERQREYGSTIVAVEPGGAEPIPLDERHGRPYHLAWVWTSPNLEFATVFVGVLAVVVFGLDLWTAAAAFVVGNALGATFHGVLTSWGPRTGLGQMALSRKAFGYRGNLLPAGLGPGAVARRCPARSSSSPARRSGRPAAGAPAGPTTPGTCGRSSTSAPVSGRRSAASRR